MTTSSDLVTFARECTPLYSIGRHPKISVPMAMMIFAIDEYSRKQEVDKGMLSQRSLALQAWALKVGNVNEQHVVKRDVSSARKMAPLARAQERKDDTLVISGTSHSAIWTLLTSASYRKTQAQDAY